MPTFRLPSLAVLAGTICAAAAAQAAPPPDIAIAQSQLRALNHRLLATGADTAAIDALIHPDFVATRADGAWLSRAEFLVDRQQQPPEGISVDDEPVRLFGPVALLHGLATSASGRSRYTDVYLWSASHWRLVSTQDSLLGKSVMRERLTGVAPIRPAWLGQQPIGADATVLPVLNANYVEAFRQADVAWYEAHLAADYVVVSGDGSYRDRSAALAQFALPSYARLMASFPVERVRVRQFGDVALIHAANPYVLKDGRTGEYRYTDIWHRQSGRWVCVAAHITTHRPPMPPR